MQTTIKNFLFVAISRAERSGAERLVATEISCTLSAHWLMGPTTALRSPLRGQAAANLFAKAVQSPVEAFINDQGSRAWRSLRRR